MWYEIELWLNFIIESLLITLMVKLMSKFLSFVVCNTFKIWNPLDWLHKFQKIILSCAFSRITITTPLWLLWPIFYLFFYCTGLILVVNCQNNGQKIFLSFCLMALKYWFFPTVGGGEQNRTPGKIFKKVVNKNIIKP